MSENSPDTSTGNELAALTPLSVIRTETVISKLPVHNLAKKGKVDIRILKRSVSGNLQLRWEVSYNDRYGQARQLAYKLDTLIVNRRLDDQIRPLPLVIRVGSLKEICRELGLGESGKNTSDVRLAFMQNASAFINAHLTYRSADGAEKRLEAGFSRYGVVFTGEKLPDGRQADAVYITLNQPYWEVLNTAPMRPLNYDYLRQLTPGAQRFYEVVSYRIFATLRNNRTHARMLYSDYCAFSAQQRYFDYEHFRVQMYKIHKPHIDSGYLRVVGVEPTVDVEGNRDWMMIYLPGPKAKAEYSTFSKRSGAEQNNLDADAAIEEASSAGTSGKSQEADPSDALLGELTARGITKRRALKLLRQVSADQPVLDQLEWGDHLIRTSSPGKFRNPAGFYLSLVEENIVPPAAFNTTRKRSLHAVENAERDRELIERQRVELLYEEYIERELDAAVASLSSEKLESMRKAKRDEYARQFPSLQAATLDEIANQGVRFELRSQHAIMSLEDFIEFYSDQNDKNVDQPSPSPQPRLFNL
jgi:hypothetical protein